MIDSINLIIYSINWINIKILKSLGIRVDKYINKTMETDNIKTITAVTEDIADEEWIRNKDYGYLFYYKQVWFKFSVKKKYMLLITNAHKILNKEIVTLNNLKSYENEINNILNEIIPDIEYEIYLSRIDYHVDIQLESKEEMETYLKLLNKHNKRFHYMKKNKEYETSVYLTTKQGQFTINIYNKEQEQINKYGIKDDTYKNILRLEVQNKPDRIRVQSKRENEPIARKLENYFCKEQMENGFFELLSKYLYEGDYITKKSAKQIINRNETLKKSQKERLKNFLDIVAEATPREVYEKEKFFCEDTVKRYIKILNKLGINPVTIESAAPYKKLENLVKRARKIAEDKYFK